ncbi:MULTISPECIES: hypothetical protein [Salinibaculum]|uniref:hypothetical protein n=1 Tax=Salinibaculum TaxID=2732368 RepID=UPI0030CE7C16
MSNWLIFGAIIGSVAVGLLAYARWGSTGGTFRDALSVIRNGFFVLAGVSLILGGFVIVGSIVIAVFVFLGTSAFLSLREDLVRNAVAPDQ